MTRHDNAPNQMPNSDSTADSTSDPKARRREQVRLAQRRRRAKLAEGNRTQVNMFLSPDAIARLDALTLLWGLERQ